MQVIDQIFQQLDEEDNGYVSTEQLISILQSLENNSENSSNQKDDMLSTQHLTYSNSPPLEADYEASSILKKHASWYNMNIFSILDDQNTG